MRVFVTGATGFVGRALIPRLQRDGHAVVAWVRSPARARGLLGAEVEFIHADTAPDGLVAAIERSDAVVNLAGEPLMGGRWTAARRAVLEGSRIAVTEQLVRAMADPTGGSTSSTTPSARFSEEEPAKWDTDPDDLTALLLTLAKTASRAIVGLGATA